MKKRSIDLGKRETVPATLYLTAEQDIRQYPCEVIAWHDDGVAQSIHLAIDANWLIAFMIDVVDEHPMRLRLADGTKTPIKLSIESLVIRDGMIELNDQDLEADAEAWIRGIGEPI